MEYEKIHRLVNGGKTMPDLVSRFISKKLVEEDNPTANGNYKENKEICFKTSMLRSGLCDYSDAYVEVTADVVVTVNRENVDNVNIFAGDVEPNPNANPPVVGADNSHKRTFNLKNNAPFISCITKIKGKLIENAEDLDVVMPMYNLTEYSKNYRKTNGSLHNYYRYEPNIETNNNNNITYPIQNSTSYDYKAKLTNRFANFAVAADRQDNDLNLKAIQVKIIVPLKHLGKFWRELNMPLVNCEVELKLKWNKTCVLVNKATRAAAVGVEIDTPKNATLTVIDCKLYVPVVTLRAVDENKLLNNLKTGFKRTITWNNYCSAITNQAANNNLNYLIDPTFTKVHRLFVLAYEN